MGKTVKKVLKVAAFVAIATFAAPIAAGIGLSAAVGTIAGSALVGAAMGAATNGILGGGILKGALMGGLAGGAGGLSKVLSTPGTPLLGDAAATAAPSAAVPAGAVDTSITGAATGGTAPGIGAGTGEIVVNAPTAGIGAAAPGLAGGGAGLAAGAPTVAGQGPPAADQSFLEQATGGPLGAVASGVTPQVAAATAPVAAAPAQAGLLTNLGTKALNTAKAIAPQLISMGIAGGAQGDIAAQQQRALEEQQRQYNDNFNLKTQYAQGLIDDANQFNAETGGRRAAESARIRAGLSASNAARLSDPRRAEAIQRQGAIEGGRNATTDYWSAYGTNAAARTNTRSAGIDRIPLESQPGSGAYESAYTSAGQTGAGIGDIIGRGIGAWTGSNRNEEELRRRQQEVG